ncbi:MAG: hypothetical protein JNL53_08070 [Cyclobacteriaceae bacterium]|nr:hypothetical protein [Cyclobacteriaceae bacterium]
MRPLKFLYTDGRDVVVTDYMLKTKKAQYHLKGVTNFGLAIIKPKILPGLILTLIGVAFLADAYFHLTPHYNLLNMKPSTEFLVGIVVVLTGLVLMLITKRKYALRIETAEGYKHVVISRSKEYIDQVVTALRKAKMTSLSVR